ncbi:heme-binding protein [Altererythrobacter sp. BO-6]|uniref:GlcG/HbpS family heme-binding protein n=1 Tax=Altererythrobacter sp. BO-6 TaxID=2604537 RepID=UPI0013E16042|nr:heme-binding protein [Altererythrobacter sp. BO-6]QIG53773.1 heme-binding protein [Altererythrobacter sp. BO-6]
MSKNQIKLQSSRLSLKGALDVIEAGMSAAEQHGAPMAICVVDPSGLALASVRMDGAPMLAVDVASKKAWTAAQTGAPSGDVIHFISGDPGSHLSMPHVDQFTVVAGGLPIVIDGERLGALGVSGASADLDLAVAEAALAALS